MIARVYYWKSTEWLTTVSLERGLPTRRNIAHDYVQVASFEVATDDLEHIWEVMNTAPSKYFDRGAYEKGIAHTSMSVGDVVMLEGRAYVAASLGFTEIKREVRREVQK